MPSTEQPRLLSPSHRRIWAIDPDKPIAEQNRTYTSLQGAGWEEYTGPARTDEHGWVIKGSDPKIIERMP